jgi:hypothetical protein
LASKPISQGPVKQMLTLSIFTVTFMFKLISHIHHQTLQPAYKHFFRIFIKYYKYVWQFLVPEFILAGFNKVIW